MEIEAKLDMSLDDLIKLQAKKNAGGRGTSNDRGAGGSARGRKQVRRSHGKQDDSNDGDMEVDDGRQAPRRTKVDTGALRATGGVSKGGRGGARVGQGGGKGGRAPAAPKVHYDDESVPRGNIDGRWKHDLHADDGPARPRIVKGGRAPEQPPRAVNVMRRLKVSNLHQDVDEADLKELFEMEGEVQHVELRRTAVTADATVDFVTEEGALRAKERYANVLLDGLPLVLRLVGVNPTERRLASGIVVTRGNGVAAGGGGHTAVRGRGAAGRLRSDEDMHVDAY